MNKNEILDAISGMSVLDLSELVSAIEEKFNVSAAAPVAVVAAGAAAGAAPEVEEQTEFDVVVTSCGESKIAVIKAVRALTGLGLKESKDLVESLPKPVKEGLSKQEAEEVSKQLTEAGAACEIK